VNRGKQVIGCGAAEENPVARMGRSRHNGQPDRRPVGSAAAENVLETRSIGLALPEIRASAKARPSSASSEFSKLANRLHKPALRSIRKY
jgi:hypothetical protein